MPGLDNARSIYAPYICIYTYVHEHTPLAKPGFCSGRTNDSKRIGAGMDIPALPLAVTIATFIVQLAIILTMIAAMVLSIVIRIRTVKLVREIVTATVVEIVAMIMIEIIIVLVAVIVLIIVQRSKIVIIVLAALTLIVIRTTIICSNKLNIDTYRNNSKSCSGTITIPTINRSFRYYGSSNGSNNRTSTHTNMKKLLVTAVITA